MEVLLNWDMARLWLPIHYPNPLSKSMLCWSLLKHLVLTSKKKKETHPRTGEKDIERCDMLERSKELWIKKSQTFVLQSGMGWIGRPKSVGISARVLRFDLDTISNGMQWSSRKGRTNRLHRTHLPSLVKSCKVIESYSAIVARTLLFEAIILRHLNS